MPDPARSEPPRLKLIDLNTEGRLIDSTAGTIADADIATYLHQTLPVPTTATDIFVFGHGWRNTKDRAATAAARLFQSVQDHYASHRDRYPALTSFRPQYVVIRWPSMSMPFINGYQRIKERAHAMTRSGRAEYLLAQLLGYLHHERTSPVRGPQVMRTAHGQYLHCIGHSFGGRLLGEAIMEAARPKGPPSLAWPWRSSDPFGIDTFLVFQLASKPSIFRERFAPLLSSAPLHGPAVLTFAKGDRANALWHRIAEGTPGIGATGILEQDASTIRLKKIHEPYALSDFATKLINIDASWRFRRGRLWRPEGSHSDYVYPESAHLILALAALAR